MKGEPDWTGPVEFVDKPLQLAESLPTSLGELRCDFASYRQADYGIDPTRALHALKQLIEDGIVSFALLVHSRNFISLSA